MAPVPAAYVLRDIERTKRYSYWGIIASATVFQFIVLILGAIGAVALAVASPAELAIGIFASAAVSVLGTILACQYITDSIKLLRQIEQHAYNTVELNRQIAELLLRQDQKP